MKRTNIQLRRQAAFSLLAIGLMVGPLAASELIEVFTEPYRSIDVAAAEPGILDQVRVRQGDWVSAGDQIACLNREVLLASLEIAKLRASQEAAQNRASAEVGQKRRRYEKIRELQLNGHASEEELDNSKALLEVALAGQLEANEKQRLASLQVLEIEAQLRQRSIASPVNGQVVNLHKDPGEYVAVQQPVVATIVQLDKLRVKFYVNTASAYGLRRGDELSVLFVDSKRHVSGVVEFVSPTTDADSSTVRLEVVIDNAKGEHRSGVRVRLDKVRQARRSTQAASSMAPRGREVRRNVKR